MKKSIIMCLAFMLAVVSVLGRAAALGDGQYYFADTEQHGISLQAARDKGFTGEGVTVAVIDSGLFADHVLAPKHVAPGRHFYFREEADGDYRVHGLYRCNFYSNSDTSDQMGHGTLISSIISEIAPEATIMPIRCFDEEPGHLGPYPSVLVSGIDYAVENGADIINISWGLSYDSSSVNAAVKRAVDAGCIVVAAAGNTGTNIVQYPARYDNVISVGATDQDGHIAQFSQYGSDVDVYAPGVRIFGNYISELTSIGHGSGTSFAAPMVSGAVALLREADPDLTYEELLPLLRMSEEPLETADSLPGAGLLDLERLLETNICRMVGKAIAHYMSYCGVKL